jgi:tetratricopeptide (TPR) repeat protein
MKRLVVSAIALVTSTWIAVADPAGDLLARGHEALRARDIVAAMEAFTAVLEADPAHGAAAYERGRLLLIIGEPENAIADFTTAVLADPSNGRAYARRGEAKLVLKDAESAIADFDQAIAVAPHDYEAHVIRATFRLKIGNLAGARTDLQNAKAVADAATVKAIQVMLDKLN